MSSGGWEVVGKNKKDKSNGKPAKLSKAEKKKFIENAPKVQDFLPLNQVKILYDNLNSNKENKKPSKEKEYKTKEKEEKKKSQKQQHPEKKKSEPKEKPPKSIKDALNMINTEEIQNVFTSAQSRFPDVPLIWLKDLAAFLNYKISVDKEDAIFSGKPKDYPLSTVPKAISSTLEKAIEAAGQQTIQLFYEITLTTMATDMTKGVAVVGHKIFLQLLAYLYPEMIIANIPKLISIRNSYQNRKEIGLSLLWAFSQGGRKNLAVGLKMWHEVMSPMLELKGYTNYIVQILSDLVFDHEDVNNLTSNIYLDIVEDTCSGNLNISTTATKEISAAIGKLRMILFKNENMNHSKLFEKIIGKINQKSNAMYRDELVKALVACLVADDCCFSVWSSIYTKHLYQSNLLLTYMSDKWDSTLKAALLKETLIVFQTTNERWKKGKDEHLVRTCNKKCKALLTKMTPTTRRTRFWKVCAVVLLLIIGGVVAHEFQKNQDARGDKVESSGLYIYIEKIRSTIALYTVEGLKYIESVSPKYYKATVDFCTSYVKLSKDIFLVGKNLSIKIYNNIADYVAQKRPVVMATIEYYGPGIIDEVQTRTNQVLSFVMTSSNYIAEQVMDRCISVVRWLEINVFVGKLSPENLHNYAKRAIDTTQTLASRTYDWVYEKVQTLSKVP